jgi:hypothetical protein
MDLTHFHRLLIPHYLIVACIEDLPMRPMHPHDAALALMGLFQEGSPDSSVADSVADELEFLTLGDN